MRRALVVLLLVAGMLCGVVTGGQPAGAQADPELTGEQPGRYSSCRGTHFSPSVAGRFNVAGSVAWVRCYVRPGSVMPSMAYFIKWKREADSGAYSSNFDTCVTMPETNLAIGRLSVRCNQTGSFTARDDVDRMNVSNLYLPGGVTPYPSVDAHLAAGVGQPSPVPFYEYVGGLSTAFPPSWPTWWPSAVDPSVPEGDTGEAPAVACRVELREGPGGTIYGDFRAGVANPDPDATDTFRWYLEWDGGVSSPRGEPTSPSFRDGRTALVGATQLGVPIPTDSVPAGGWWVQVQVARLYEDEVQTEVPAEIQTEGSTLDDINANWWGRLRRKVTFGIWDTPEIAVYEYVDGTRIHTDRIAWQTVRVPCPLTIRPERAGTPSGDVGTVVGPSVEEDPETVPFPDDDDEGGGGEDCERPSGLTLDWAAYYACQAASALGGGLGDLLSELGDAIGSLLDVLGNLVGDLLDMLTDLFVPDDLDWSWDDLKTSAEGRAPFVYVAAVTNTVDDVLDQDRDASCVPVGISEATEQCMEGPTSDFPGVAVIRNIFVVVIWVGVGSRILRTAPWAKGRDGGEPL